MPFSKWASRCRPTRPSKVAGNYRLGKLKANRKKLVRRGVYKFEDNVYDNNNNNNNDSLSLNKMTTANVTASYTKSEDLGVMSFVSLPAESAFAMCAIMEMDGVGKGYNSDFDFIINLAPYTVEIRGADK